MPVSNAPSRHKGVRKKPMVGTANRFARGETRDTCWKNSNNKGASPKEVAQLIFHNPLHQPKVRNRPLTANTIKPTAP